MKGDANSHSFMAELQKDAKGQAPDAVSEEIPKGRRHGAGKKSSTAMHFLRALTPKGINGTVIAIDPEKKRGDEGQIAALAYTSETVENVAVFIAEHQAQRHNMYWSPNPTHSLLDKKPLKADIALMRWVHLDLDDPSAAALARVRAYKLPPTMIVASGGGFNVYWALAEPVQANGNIAELEDANRRVILDLGADKGTQNLDRILRLPGTMNWPTKTKLKRGRVPVPAHLVEINPKRRYSLEDFPRLTEDERRNWNKSTPSKPAETTAITSDRSRDLMAKVAKAIKDGQDDDDIHAALDRHPHAGDQADPARAVQRCIDKVRCEHVDIVARVNSENALIWVKGKFYAMWPDKFEGGMPRLSTIADTKNYWKKYQRGKTSPVDYWLGSLSRREFDGFTFRPGILDTGDKKFNLFRGWGVTPDPEGDCSLFLAHLKEVICNNDADLFDYLEQWLANAVQTPMDKPGTAIAMRSRQGAGKGRIPDYLDRIFGAHLWRVGSSEQLLHKFNAYLASKVIIFGDEAAWPGDKRGRDKLKHLITEKKISVEEKGLPLFEIDNYARYLLATNRDHAAPAEFDDRRYVMLDVSNTHVGDKDYWNALEAECKGSGPAAFLHHLLNVKLTRDLRETPKTAALAEQKLMDLDDVGGFVRELLTLGKLTIQVHDPKATGFHPYQDSTLCLGEIATTAKVHQFYLDYCKRNGRRFTNSMDGLGIGIRKYFSLVNREARTDECKRLGLKPRARVYALPTLEDAREQFALALNQPVPWAPEGRPDALGIGTAESDGS